MLSAAALHVLVVNDQRSIRLLLCDTLKQVGIRNMEEAEDGEDGVKRLTARPAHLVISDFNMPKLDGLGFLRAVRKDPTLGKTPFIMLTSASDETIVKRGIELGLNNYLPKHFSVGSLRRKIEAVFGMFS